jgi:glycosyltransferase involved in cell wall biosynthesis
VETLQESFGITPLEAMASGLPAVVSDWSGYRDTVAHRKTGFHVKTYWADCNATTSLLAPLYEWTHDHFQASQTVALDTAELYHYLDLLNP